MELHFLAALATEKGNLRESVVRLQFELLLLLPI